MLPLTIVKVKTILRFTHGLRGRDRPAPTRGISGRVMHVRVDRLAIEMSMHRGAYTAHVTAWDGLKGRLTHVGTYESLGFAELLQVLEGTVESYRPGTEYWLQGDQTFTQAPLFD